MLIRNGTSALGVDVVARTRGFAFVASRDNESTKIVSKREYAKTIVATVVDPILTSFCDRIKAVRTLTAAKLPAPCDVAAPRVSRQICNCPNACAATAWRGQVQYRVPAPPWHCVWHTAYYWPRAHKLLAEQPRFTFRLRCKIQRVVRGITLWSRDWLHDYRSPRRIMRIRLQRKRERETRRADCNRVRDNFPANISHANLFVLLSRVSRWLIYITRVKIYAGLVWTTFCTSHRSFRNILRYD